MVLIAKREQKAWTSRRRAARELHLIWKTNFPGAPDIDSLEKALYRHETGRTQVRDEIYRRLYCLAYDATPGELFGDEEYGDAGLDSHERSGRLPDAQQHELISRIDSMPWLRDFLAESLEAIDSIEAHYAGTMAPVLCRQAFDDCLRQLLDLRRGQFEAPFDDNELVYALTRRTERDLLATSVEEVDLKWWQSAAGQTYWRLHKEALQRGVRIQRIFVYRAWTAEHEALASLQHEHGVHTLRVSNEQLPPDLRIDMIMWDGLCGYESRVNSSGEAITNNYTFVKRDLDRMLDRYKVIESCAEEWPCAQKKGSANA
jgi:hypothetical protein